MTLQKEHYEEKVSHLHEAMVSLSCFDACVVLFRRLYGVN